MRHASSRAATSAAAGVVVAAVAAFLAPWQVAVMGGWVAATGVYLARAWRALLAHDGEATRAHATRVDETRFVTDLSLLGASVASLGAVAVLLVKASEVGGAAEAGYTALGVGAVVLSWAVVHTVFTIRYAHLYYADAIGGVDFNTEEAPSYVDFAYLAFTIGMTYQVSDTNLTDPRVRATALRHGLLSFVFGTAIIATMINVVAGLLH